MKLRTSFFKGITLKKDILRFAPIWALYLIGMMLVLLEVGGYSNYSSLGRNFIPGCIKAFGIVNLCYATLIAAALFGDLYNTKLCYSLHAMPYRRESWLVTHLLAGLLFSLVPNLIACAYLMARLKAFWFLALYWLLAVTLQFVFFYGLATLSAMLTGNRFAMLLVCAGFNFVSMLLYATVNVIYIPMLTGVVANLEDFSRFSPVVQLFRYDFFTFIRETVKQQTPMGTFTEDFYHFDGLSDGWGYLAILGIAGLAVMGLSVWLYRKRHLEAAGDFIAFPRLKGIACVIMTLCVTLCFALLGELFGSMILWLIVGLIIGYFGSLMLLERRLKVLRKKTLPGFIAMALAVTLSMFAISGDWFGIESWTPKADRVASVTVSNTRSDRYYNGLHITLEDEYDIQQIITAHEDILGRIGSKASSYHTVRLVYKMKSGRTVTRYYRTPATGEGYEIVYRYLYRADSVLGFTNPKAAAEVMDYMYSNYGQIPVALYEKLLTALQKDQANGHVLLQNGAYDEYLIEYYFEGTDGISVHRSLSIHEDAKNVIALLESPECILGYTDWDDFLANVHDLSVTRAGISKQIQPAQCQGLLSALCKDLQEGNVLLKGYSEDAYGIHYQLTAEDGSNQYREFYITKNAKNTVAWLQDHEYLPKPE